MNTPPEVIDAPGGTNPGPSSNVKVRMSPPSGSEAVAVKVISVNSSPDWGPTGSNTGGEFKATTVTAPENSELASKVVQAAIVQWVLMAVITSPAEPGKLWLNDSTPEPVWVTFTNAANTSPSP